MSIAQAPVPLTVMDHDDPELLAELLRAVEGVAATGAFIGGAAVERFEAELAAWCEVSDAVGVSSGTDALVLALRALGVGPGDEVVVPANSFIATAEAVSIVGASPIFADVDERTQLITAETLVRAITPRVCCVIPVHLFGRTVELAPIVELACAGGYQVIEDCAQAHGARYRGARVGTIGDAGTFSFYPAKNLGAWGDAGAVVTKRGEIAEAVRLMRSHGENPRYRHRVVGMTGRLDAIQAAILRHKLPRLERATDARRRVAGALCDGLADVETVALPAPLAAGEDHVFHQFVIRTAGRDELRALLASEGVASGIHYPVPIHHSEAYASKQQGDDVAPVATKLSGEILSLPMFPAMSAKQIERVVDVVCRCAARVREPLPIGVG